MYQNVIKNYRLLANARSNDLGRLEDDLKTQLATGKIDANYLWSALDVACANDKFRSDFAKSLVKFGVISAEDSKKFRKYTAEEQEKTASAMFALDTETGVIDTKKIAEYNQAMQEAKAIDDEAERIAHFAAKSPKIKEFAVDAGAFLETNVIPLLEGLIRTSPTVSRISMITGVDYKNLIEFGEEKDAESLAKGGAGTEADDTTRTALTLDTNNKKIQASSRINRRDLITLAADEWAMFIQRLINRIMYRMDYMIYYAAGSSNQWQRGLKNSAGSDSTDMIGALQSTGLTGSVIDKLKQMDKDLSTLTSASEESMYTYSVNRKLMADLKLAKDLNGNYYFPQGLTAEAIQVNGHGFVVSPAVADDEVFLSPLAYYTAIVAEEMNIVNDQGLVNLKEDEIIYVSRVYSDGSPRKAFKRTVGGSSDNNQQQNYHRYASVA